VVKPVSEQLAAVSARAKQAEDEVQSAKKKASAEVQKREEKIKADAARRKASLRENAARANENIDSAWSGLQGQVQHDFDNLRAKIDFKKYQHDRDKALRAADDAEESAVRSIDFALDAIDYAETAVLDAVLARETANSF
jgi:hypothetical protein